MAKKTKDAQGAQKAAEVVLSKRDFDTWKLSHVATVSVSALEVIVDQGDQDWGHLKTLYVPEAELMAVQALLTEPHGKKDESDYRMQIRGHAIKVTKFAGHGERKVKTYDGLQKRLDVSIPFACVKNLPS